MSKILNTSGEFYSAVFGKSQPALTILKVFQIINEIAILFQRISPILTSRVL